MDVSVHHKHGQRRLQALGKPSILGAGLLERARSTTFALLGMTAAVGLAMVALALNQSWPLIAGSSIPSISPGQRGIGEAEVVAGKRHPRSVAAQPAPSRGARGSARAAHRASAGTSPGAVAPGVATEFVVSPSTPAAPQDGGSQPPPESGSAPAGQGVGEVAATPAAPSTPTPASPATPTSASTPAGAQTTPPPPATPEEPVEEPEPEPEAEAPSWGHGYGDGEDDEWGGGGWHGHGYDGSHGHRFGH